MKRSAPFLLVAVMLAVTLCLLLVAVPGSVRAQATGKLSGTVKDEANGAPIPGASVVLLGTTLGSATDADGKYFMIGIAPATYDVRVSFVGYRTKVVEGVLVTSDRTTGLDVTIGEDVVGAEEIVVGAERAIVDANQTTSRALITGEEISRLPVANLSEVISKTSNSYEGHIRGSRLFETKTVLEGVDISDAFYSLAPFDSYQRLNANKTVQRSPSLFELNPDGISEVAVTSGATEARYTSGSGGVVTVNLTERRGPIRGAFMARVSPGVGRPGPDSLDFYNEHVRKARADEAHLDLDGDGFISTGEAYFETKANVERLAAAGDTVAASRLRFFTWRPDKYDAGSRPDVDLRGNVGGSMTGNLHFFFLGRYNESHGYMPNQFDARLSAQLKATYELSAKSSITAIGLLEDRGYFLGQWKNRDYVDHFRFTLESVAQNEAGSYLGSLRWRQVLDEHSFLTAQVYRTYDRDRYGYPDDDGDGYTELGEDGDFIDFADPAVIRRYIDVSGTRHDKMFEPEHSCGDFCSSRVRLDGQEYPTSHPDPYSEDTRATTHGIKLDYTNQVVPSHLLQVGAEAKFRNYAYEQVLGIDFGSTYGSPQKEGSCDAEGGSCRNREPYAADRYNRSPWEIDVYASDRMEYAGLIINLGARVEVHNRDAQDITDYYYPLRQTGVVASEFWGRSVAGTDTLTRNLFRRGDDVGLVVSFNPSIGVSHPIGSNAAMYFSYKRATQMQPYARCYNRYDGIHASEGFFFAIPEPRMDPIVSDNYELGLQWEFTEDLGVDVNAYVRAIDNYNIVFLGALQRIPSDEVPIDLSPAYGYQTDFGYADSRGIELVLRSARLRVAEKIRLSLTASYTFSTVEGTENAGIDATAYTSQGDDDTQLPFDNAEDLRHVPINVKGGSFTGQNGFDRRHRGVLRGAVTFPHEVSLGLNASVESGFLYPPAVVDEVRDRKLLTGPTNYTIDLRLEKKFSLRRYGFDLFADVTNLTNAHNVIAYDNGFQGTGATRFQQTGVPSSTLVLHNGSRSNSPVYGPGRQMYFGVRMNM